MRFSIILIVIAVTLSGATAAHAKKKGISLSGKELFNYVDLGGGDTGRSCNSCHPDGKGLHGVVNKKTWKTPNGVFTTLEKAIKSCQLVSPQAKATKWNKVKVRKLVAYLKSL